MASSAPESAKLAIQSRHSGILLDGSDDLFIVRSDAELERAKAAVATNKPVYASGRMAIEGWEDRDDPLTTGALAAGVDWAEQSIVVVGGRQCTIEEVRLGGESGLDIACASDDSQHHGREYAAVVVSPPVPEGAEPSVSGLEGAFVAVAPRPMSEGRLAADSGPEEGVMLEQRPANAMLEQRPANAMLEQRPAVGIPASLLEAELPSALGAAPSGDGDLGPRMPPAPSAMRPALR